MKKNSFISALFICVNLFIWLRKFKSVPGFQKSGSVGKAYKCTMLDMESSSERREIR